MSLCGSLIVSLLLQASLKDVEVVVIPAGVPRKPGMTRDDLFNTNASIVATIAQACAKVSCYYEYATCALKFHFFAFFILITTLSIQIFCVY